MHSSGVIDSFLQKYCLTRRANHGHNGNLAQFAGRIRRCSGDRDDHRLAHSPAGQGRADAAGLRREIAEMISDDEIAMAQRDARAWINARPEARV